MDFEVNAEKLSEAGSRALGAIVSKFRLYKNITYCTFNKLYDASVTPVIDYASEIWGFAKGSSFYKIQHRALRYFLGVHKFCPIPAMYGDMGWSECRPRRFMNMLRYWNRLVKMSDDRLTKKIFIYDYEQSRNGCRNWCSDVECILDDINKFEPYLDKSECLLEEAFTFI